MSMRPSPIEPVPEETARIARAAFCKGNLLMRIRDEIGVLYDDQMFTSLYDARGQLAIAPWRLIKAAAGLVTYIGNNAGAITDYAARWDHGEIISTAFADVDLVISRRFAKKQQMQWSKKGAHRLLQTRTRTLDGTLHDLFTTLVSGHARQRWSGSTPRCRSLSNLPRFLVLSLPNPADRPLSRLSVLLDAARPDRAGCPFHIAAAVPGSLSGM